MIMLESSRASKHGIGGGDQRVARTAALLGMLCDGWAPKANQTKPTDFVGARRGQQQLWGGVGQRASKVAGTLCTRGQADNAGHAVAAASAVAALVPCSCCRTTVVTLEPVQRPDAALSKEAHTTARISCC